MNPGFTGRDLNGRGMNVGLDRVGSLVEALVLAYTGAALPLLVLSNLNGFGWCHSLNIASSPTRSSTPSSAPWG